MNFGRVGLVIKVVTNGTLRADIADVFEQYGPCDGLKSDTDILVSGQPADALTAETVTDFPVLSGQWDATGWAALSAVTGTGADVWAGWYVRTTR